MPSSVIRAFAYDPAAETLTITFVSGKRYAYRDVPAALFEQMRRAFSEGEFFNAVIRDQFEYQRLR